MNKSLRTRDNLVHGNIFQDTHNPFSENRILNYSTKLLNGNKIISTKLFTDSECDKIIKYCENLNKEEISNKYHPSIRQSKQVCIYDKTFAQRMFENLGDIIQTEFEDISPYGLNTGKKWKLLGMNNCVRFNFYESPSNGFKPHYDAALCVNDNIKSALSIVIYLNGHDTQRSTLNSMRGGNTIFFDKEKKIDVPGLSLKRN